MTNGMILNGCRRTIGEPGEDAGIIHILVAGDCGDRVSEVLEVEDGSWEEIECPKVAIPTLLLEEYT